MRDAGCYGYPSVRLSKMRIDDRYDMTLERGRQDWVRPGYGSG